MFDRPLSRDENRYSTDFEVGYRAGRALARENGLPRDVWLPRALSERLSPDPYLPRT